MTLSVSYRLDSELKARVAEYARGAGISETALVSRLLDEGLKTSAYPGIVYRDGPAGRRAAVAGYADVWEIVIALRHTGRRGEQRVHSAAAALDIPARAVRAAVAFASAYPVEVDAMISRNEAAMERARQAAAERERFLAS